MALRGWLGGDHLLDPVALLRIEPVELRADRLHLLRLATRRQQIEDAEAEGVGQRDELVRLHRLAPMLDVHHRGSRQPKDASEALLRESLFALPGLGDAAPELPVERGGVHAAVNSRRNCVASTCQTCLLHKRMR